MSVANLVGQSVGQRPIKEVSHNSIRTIGQSSQTSSIAVPATLRWLIFALSLTAGAVSVYLAWVAYTAGNVAGCGGAYFDCDHVLHSRWSSVLSVPVSVPAIATHLAIISLVVGKPSLRGWEQNRWQAIAMLAFVAGGAALWFIALQFLALRSLCLYCLIAHACGLTLAGLVLVKRPVPTNSLRWAAAAATGSMAVLIALQLTNPEPQTFEVIEHASPSMESLTAPRGESVEIFSAPTSDPEAADATLFEAPTTDRSSARLRSHDPTAALSGLLLSLHPSVLMLGQLPSSPDSAGANESKQVQILNNVKLDTSQWPIIGNPNADYVFVELFDYTCPHCQRTHLALEGARKKYGDSLAVLVLPVPLNTKCNPSARSNHAKHAESCELANLAIAVWLLDRGQFESFHNYLFTAKPRYSEALIKANQMLGEEALRTKLASAVPSQYIAKHVSLYQKAGAGTIPKLMFPATSVVGEVSSAESLINLIERHLVQSRR